MGENAEVIRRHFEDLNGILAEGGDLTGLALRDVDPDCVSELGAMEGTFHGHEGFIRYFDGQRAVIEGLQIHPLEIIEADDEHVVMPFHLHGKARETGLPVEFRYAQLFRMRDGKFLSAQMYATKEKALAAAGWTGEPSIQERYLLTETCFGCGPHNPGGLHIRSFPAPDGGGVVSTWQPSPQHAASSGALNGGIVSTLLDCHSAAAVVQEMVTREPERRDEWVTAELSVKFKRPAPPQHPMELFARVVDWAEDRVRTEAELRSDGKVRATATALFAKWVPRDGT
jgi:acyl-coenzyme A thioesterase PaaI-like protein/ketosteroid isomerase-like protein